MGGLAPDGRSAVTGWRWPIGLTKGRSRKGGGHATRGGRSDAGPRHDRPVTYSALKDGACARFSSTPGAGEASTIGVVTMVVSHPGGLTGPPCPSPQALQTTKHLTRYRVRRKATHLMPASATNVPATRAAPQRGPRRSGVCLCTAMVARTVLGGQTAPAYRRTCCASGFLSGLKAGVSAGVLL
jgi:hypothetical protein